MSEISVTCARCGCLEHLDASSYSQREIDRWRCGRCRAGLRLPAPRGLGVARARAYLGQEVSASSVWGCFGVVAGVLVLLVAVGH